MWRLWMQLGSLVLFFCLLAGCRTTPPDLKPPTQPEEYNIPPSEARFNAPHYPREAMAHDDLARKLREAGNTGILPTKGFGQGGMGGMGGMR